MASAIQCCTRHEPAHDDRSNVHPYTAKRAPCPTRMVNSSQRRNKQHARRISIHALHQHMQCMHDARFAQISRSQALHVLMRVRSPSGRSERARRSQHLIRGLCLQTLVGVSLCPSPLARGDPTNKVGMNGFSAPGQSTQRRHRISKSHKAAYGATLPIRPELPVNQLILLELSRIGPHVAELLATATTTKIQSAHCALIGQLGLTRAWTSHSYLCDTHGSSTRDHHSRCIHGCVLCEPRCVCGGY